MSEKSTLSLDSSEKSKNGSSPNGKKKYGTDLTEGEELVVFGRNGSGKEPTGSPITAVFDELINEAKSSMPTSQVNKLLEMLNDSSKKPSAGTEPDTAEDVSEAVPPGLPSVVSMQHSAKNIMKTFLSPRANSTDSASNRGVVGDGVNSIMKTLFSPRANKNDRSVAKNRGRRSDAGRRSNAMHSMD